MADTDDDLTPDDLAAAAERRRQIDEIERDLAELERRRSERMRLPDVQPPSSWLQ